jgi:hypothetical protein
MQQMGSINNPKVALRHVHPWRMAVSGLVILVAGIGLGVAGTLIFAPPVRPIEPSPDLDMAVAGMVRWARVELGLSEDQVQKIEATFRGCMKKLEELRQEARPKITEQIQAMNKDIAKVLTEDQRQDWQRMTERLERDLQRGFRDRGPGGRGGPRGGRGFGPEGGRRGGMGPGDPNAPRPWGAGFGPGDSNAPRLRGGGFGMGDPNGFRGDRPPWFDRPRGEGFGSNDPNGPRGDRPPWFDRARGPNDLGRPQWREGREPNDFRRGDRPPPD